MKRITILLLLLIFVCSHASANKFTVVIDAGHGGKDSGATRGKSYEKNINLAVALNLGKLIENNNKDVKVVYTRKTDVAIDLDKRAAISNKAKANLFISIHTNSTDAKTTSAKGADTYILGLARSAENMRVAQRENSVITLEENYQQKYENFDPKSPESYIIFEFMTNKYMEQSLELAGFIQDNFRSSAKRTDRGVRQAGFLVLRETACPSVLIELGFINNPDEAKYLSSAIGQRTMASAIYAAFKEYKKSMDRRQASPLTEDTAPAISVNIDTKTEQVAATETKPQEPKSNTSKSAGTTFISKPKTTPVIPQQPSNGKSSQPTEANPAGEKETTDNTGQPKTAQPGNKPNTAEPQPNKNTAHSNGNTGIDPNTIIYKVQIMTNARKLQPNASNFKGLSPVDVYEDGKSYKYTYGATSNRDEARRLLREAKTKYADAFIIEFKDGKRIK